MSFRPLPALQQTAGFLERDSGAPRPPVDRYRVWSPYPHQGTSRGGGESVRLHEVEARLAAQKEEERTREARDRLLAIKRADGSLAASEDDDEKRVREKVAELAEAINRLNERYVQRVRVRAEAEALCAWRAGWRRGVRRRSHPPGRILGL